MTRILHIIINVVIVYSSLFSINSFVTFQGIRSIHINNHRKYQYSCLKKTTDIESDRNNDIDVGVGFPNLIDKRPQSALFFAFHNFQRELKQLTSSNPINEHTIATKNNNNNQLLNKLILTNDFVVKIEKEREERDGHTDFNPVARQSFNFACFLIDKFFNERPIARFWFLEIFARIPYFSYISILHLYETLGWWRQPLLRRVHHEEEWNELHHLLIMESLGGNEVWFDRFLGYHIAIAYYWFIVGVYLLLPSIAYEFSELVELHAVDTYNAFITENMNTLKEIPAPAIASNYYSNERLYRLEEFGNSLSYYNQTIHEVPPCSTLYDIFINIRNDELEHVSTMKACKNFVASGNWNAK